MKKINVSLKVNPYDVLIDAGIIKNFAREFKKRNLPTSYFIIIDKNVKEKYPLLLNEFSSPPRNIYVLVASEKKKSYETLQHIHKKMIAANLTRNSVVVAIGGGITGDIAGFAASTYMRGIKYVQVPTTLLSAVDSSVGGKTGINYNNTKNIIGSFYQPKLALIDTVFFNSLPEEEVICGVGELIKYAFITSRKFSNYITKNLNKIISLDEKTITKIVFESVGYKSAVVIEDERERGLRKVLNFGHTFAHAIEVEQNHKIKHGQAVIIGIACAVFLSEKVGLINNEQRCKYLHILQPFMNRIKLKEYDRNKIYLIMGRDKKNSSGKRKFVLIKDIGEIVIDYEAEKKDVLYAIDEGLKLFVQ